MDSRSAFCRVGQNSHGFALRVADELTRAVGRSDVVLEVSSIVMLFVLRSVGELAGCGRFWQCSSMKRVLQASVQEVGVAIF